MLEKRQAEELIQDHAERNRELLASLAERGVSLDEPRSIELHFWAAGQADAAQLGAQLYGMGYLILMLAPSAKLDSDPLWNVEAGVHLSPAHVTDDAFTRVLVELSERFEGSYDGWGTSI